MQYYDTRKVFQKELSDIMAQCKLCKIDSSRISKELGVCLKCIREMPDNALPIAMQAHRRVRAVFGLPEESPKDPQGLPCNICVNECRIPEDGMGYCGLRKNGGGRLTGVSPEEGKLLWYHDSLPTNCVGDWVCPGGTGAGYPAYAYSSGPECGYKNLAVFFHACSFNCLYCQSWHFRNETLRSYTTSVHKLASDVDEKTSCICYFGGDPTPQLPFALRASRLTRETQKGRVLRICWETNGSMHEGLLDKMVDLSLNSGGCIKVDLKAWDENLHIALTGITSKESCPVRPIPAYKAGLYGLTENRQLSNSNPKPAFIPVHRTGFSACFNKRTLENFSRVAERIKTRPVPPLLIASTLLVPGYIDENEVRGIARFIASINPEIPYSMLAFYPHFYMSDLPLTSKVLSERCLKAAQEEGLKNVRIGNVHLLI